MELFFEVYEPGFILDHGSSCENLAEAYIFSFIVVGTPLSSMDSDLEAISHNPTDDSFTALAVQPTVLTNYLNQLFLSY